LVGAITLPRNDTDLASWNERIVRVVELVGVLLILSGAAAATARFLARWASTGLDTAYREYRQHLGRAILLGLEFLVAGDIINTVAVDPTFRSVGVLAGIVVIRTFLSFSSKSKSKDAGPGLAHNSPMNGLHHLRKLLLRRPAIVEGTSIGDNRYTGRHGALSLS
jgi:uncharacterized membrane protein